MIRGLPFPVIPEPAAQGVRAGAPAAMDFADCLTPPFAPAAPVERVSATTVAVCPPSMLAPPQVTGDCIPHPPQDCPAIGGLGYEPRRWYVAPVGPPGPRPVHDFGAAPAMVPPPPPSQGPFMAEPLADTGDAPLQWQVRASTEGGVELWWPWQLMATPHLSQRSAVHGLPMVTTAPPTTEKTAMAADPKTIAAASPEPWSAVVSTGPRKSEVHAPSTATVDIAADEVGIDVTNERGAAMPAAGLPWARRLLRWLESQDQAATAWVRDYTVAARGEAELIADLRRFAQSEGLPLRRIVLNGRTVWTADLQTLPETR